MGSILLVNVLLNKKEPKRDAKDAAGLAGWLSEARRRVDDDADGQVADLLHKRERVRAEEAQINRELGEIANLRAKLEAELVEVAREIALAARRERSLVRRFFRWASAVTVLRTNETPHLIECEARELPKILEAAQPAVWRKYGR